jgi:hypothetical protein
MDLWIAVILFLVNIGDDILAVLFIRRTTQGKALQACFLSMLLTIIVAFSVINYVHYYWYLLPVCLGSGLGTYLGVKYDKDKNEHKLVY